MIRPEVSVLVLTFNHARYIRQCLDSLISQDYPNYRIYIGDDCSTDATEAIVKDYVSRYPEKIKARINGVNIGSHKNFKQLINECSSEWFAICEGDDYWIDNSKLSKQMTALANNPECVMCFSQAVVLDIGKTRFPTSFLSPHLQQQILTRKDFLRRDFAQNCTCVYKREIYLKLGDWHSDFLFGDYSFQLESLKEGDAFFVNEPLAVYRVHADGIWSSKKEVSRLSHQIEFLMFYYNKELESENKKHILKNVIEKYFLLFKLRMKAKLQENMEVAVSNYAVEGSGRKFAWKIIRFLNLHRIILKLIQVDISKSRRRDARLTAS